MLALACIDLASPATEQLVAGFATSADFGAAQRFRFAHRRRQFLAGRALLRRLLEQEVGWPRQLCRIAYDGNGRPAVFARNRSDGIDASITHSRDRVACAITAFGQLGIDIELRAPERAANRIAAAFFGPREQRIVATDGNAAFYRLWTLREAMVKALGEGIPQWDVHGGCFEPEPPRGEWRSRLGQHTWMFGHRILAGQYSLAVALRLNAEASTTATWDTFRRRWRQVIERADI